MLIGIFNFEFFFKKIFSKKKKKNPLISIQLTFLFSLREKTHAHRNYDDDVDPLVKKRRLNEIIQLFRQQSKEINKKFIGTTQLILVEGDAEKKNKVSENEELIGRCDSNKKIVFPKEPIPSFLNPTIKSIPKVGDYVQVILSFFICFSFGL